MNIVVTFNERFYRPFEIFCFSLFKNSNYKHIRLYIIYEQELPSQLLTKIQALYSFEVIPIQLPAIYSNLLDLIQSQENLTIFTREASLRIFIPFLIPEDRCLYLDTDTVINRPLKKLYTLDLQDKYIAGVQDDGLDHFVNYINSGVILFDLQKIRQNPDYMDLPRLEKIFQEKKQDSLFDQEVINQFYFNKIFILNLKFNRYLKYPDSKIKLKTLIEIKTSYILHFLGKKPWDIKNADGPYKTLIWTQYCRKFSKLDNRYTKVND